MGIHLLLIPPSGGVGQIGATMTISSIATSALPAAPPALPAVRFGPAVPRPLARPAIHSRAHVVHLSAEYGDLARTGGLAEAVAGLAGAQARSGSPRAAVIIPLHAAVRASGLLERADLGPIDADPGLGPTPTIWRRVPRVGQDDLFALELPGFDRAGVYGEGGHDYPDNPVRFAAFVRAALGVLPVVAPAVRILHVHDWHTAFAPAYLRTRLAGRRFYDQIATVLTVHNGAYQGRFGREGLARLDLPPEVVDALEPDREGRLSWLELGVRFADMVTTVSPTHAEELRTPLGGFGLHHHFLGLGDRLIGLRNGIESSRWDPAHDPALAAPFDADRPEGRARCRAELERELAFADDGAPLVAVIARLVAQKGVDLLLDGTVVERFPEVRLVVVGDGSPDYAERLRALAARFPDRVRAPLPFDGALERRVLAGADLLLVPSLYEPCGLVQLHAQRYGAVPVVRRVGGLAETVTDGLNGFVFGEYSIPALADALGRALEARRDGARWAALVERAMRQDVGWGRAVGGYQNVYRAASTRHAGWIGAGDAA